MVPSPWAVCDGGGTCLPRDQTQAQTLIPTEGAGPPLHEHTGHVSVPPLEDGGQFSAGRACRQGPGQPPQNSEKCSLSPPQRTVLPTLSLQLFGIQGTENLGVSSRRVSQTGSKDSHTLIPGQLPSDSLTPRGDTTQWAGQHSFKARPAPPFTYLWLWEPTGLCFLFRQMKTIGPTQQVVMRIK